MRAQNPQKMYFLGMQEEFCKAYYKGFQMQERSGGAFIEKIIEKQLWRQVICWTFINDFQVYLMK